VAAVHDGPVYCRALQMSAFVRDEEEQTFRRLCAAVMVGRGEEFLLSLKIGRLVSMPHVIDSTDIEIFLASLTMVLNRIKSWSPHS